MDAFLDPEILASVATLTLLEIVLGIDNIVFVSLLTLKLPIHQQAPARLIGLTLAMVSRILLLFCIVHLMHLSKPLFTLFDHPFSIRDLILIGGGLFLIAKGTREIHDRSEPGEQGSQRNDYPSFAGTLLQIMLLDIVFSIDSVITAVGMASELWVMVTAVVLAVLVMMFFSGIISRFIENNPAIKVLALAFLLLIGTVLIADGIGQHIPKGYIYSAMAFSIFVEMLNIKMGNRPINKSKSDKPRVLQR